MKAYYNGIEITINQDYNAAILICDFHMVFLRVKWKESTNLDRIFIAHKSNTWVASSHRWKALVQSKKWQTSVTKKPATSGLTERQSQWEMLSFLSLDKSLSTRLCVGGDMPWHVGLFTAHVRAHLSVKRRESLSKNWAKTVGFTAHSFKRQSRLVHFQRFSRKLSFCSLSLILSKEFERFEHSSS